jgi:hypothetical protein
MRALIPLLAAWSGVVGVESANDDLELMPRFSVELVPRLSFGHVSGFKITDSEFRQAATDIGAAPDAEYVTHGGANIELAVLFAPRDDGRFYLITGPALLYSKNSNEYVLNPPNARGFGSDVFSAMGAKWYLGAGYSGVNGFRTELMPYVGLARLNEETIYTTVENLTRAVTITSSNDTGRAFLYGVVLGAYFTFEGTRGLQIGGRLGYAGAKASVDGTEVEQDGILVAAEIGLSL